MLKLICSALLLLSACSGPSHSPGTVSTNGGPEETLAENALIESDALWNILASGISNAPEIKYARRLGGRLENGFNAELALASAVAATPPAKCQKLSPIDIVMSSDGKVTKAVNRARSCWVNGTRMAIKASQSLQADAPPAGLLKNGQFKFSWTPDMPEKKAAEKEEATR